MGNNIIQNCRSLPVASPLPIAPYQKPIRKKALEHNRRINRKRFEVAQRVRTPERNKEPSSQQLSLNCIEDCLLEADYEWSEVLLLNFSEALNNRERKFDTIWTLDLELLEQAVKTESIREVFSREINPIPEVQDILKSSQVSKAPSEFTLFQHPSFLSPGQQCPSLMSHCDSDSPYLKTEDNKSTYQKRKSTNKKPRHITIEEVFEKKQQSTLFRKKMAMIQKHMRSHKHILRMFIDSFVKTMGFWLSDQDNPSTASDDANANEPEERRPSKDKPILDDLDKYSKISYDDESDSEEMLRDDAISKSPTSVQRDYMDKFDFVINATQNFKSILIAALALFYSIDLKSLEKNQHHKHQFEQLVTQILLNTSVSTMLKDIADKAFESDINFFQQAIQELHKLTLKYLEVDPKFQMDWQYRSQFKQRASSMAGHSLKDRSNTVAQKFEKEKPQKFVLNIRKASQYNQSILSDKSEMSILKNIPDGKKDIAAYYPSGSDGEEQESGSPRISKLMTPFASQIEGSHKNSEQRMTDVTPQNWQPYFKSISVFSAVSTLNSFEMKKKCYQYIRRKMQNEILEFWKGYNMDQDNLNLNEDNRLNIVAYQIVKSEYWSIFTDCKVLKYFVNLSNFEESATLTTLESAIEVILFEYENYNSQPENQPLFNNNTDRDKSGSGIENESKRSMVNVTLLNKYKKKMDRIKYQTDHENVEIVYNAPRPKGMSRRTMSVCKPYQATQEMMRSNEKQSMDNSSASIKKVQRQSRRLLQLSESSIENQSQYPKQSFFLDRIVWDKKEENKRSRLLSGASKFNQANSDFKFEFKIE